MLALMICNGNSFSTDTRINIFVPIGNSPSINICVSTSLSADISIIFVCHLVFIIIFVFIVICISTTDIVRLSIITNLYFIFDLYCYANIFFRACISKHGFTNIVTNLCYPPILLSKAPSSYDLNVFLL